MYMPLADKVKVSNNLCNSGNRYFTNKVLDYADRVGHDLVRVCSPNQLREATRPLSTQALTPEILRSGETPARSFDPKSAAPFVNKSVSEATRRAYGRAVTDFFLFAGGKHPTAGCVDDGVRLCRPLSAKRKEGAPNTL